MQRSSVHGIVILFLGLTNLAGRAQTQIDARTQTKNIDFSGAVSTKPVKTVADLPASCSIGELVIKLNDSAGKYLYTCSAANTWTSWSAQAGLPALDGQADKVLSNDGTAAGWRAIGGDVAGGPEATTVTGLRGRPVANTAPADSEILAWDGGLSQWTPKRYWFSQILGVATNAQLPSTPAFVSVTTGDGSSAGEISLYEAAANGNSYVSLVAPDSLSSQFRYILPAEAPAANQLLQAAGAPDAGGTVVTRWATVAGGGGLGDPGANGVVKRTAAGQTAIATGADLPSMGPSGASHSAGAVPDPGATAGTTRFLREDGTWVAPAGGSGPSATIYLGSSSGVASGGPYYLGPVGLGGSTTETNRMVGLPVTGTATDFTLTTHALQPSTGDLVCTLRYDGAAASPSVVMTVAASAAAGTVITNSAAVAVTAGHKVGWSCTNGASSTSAYFTSIFTIQ